ATLLAATLRLSHRIEVLSMRLTACLLTLLLLGSSAPAQRHNVTPKGFPALFDGKTVDGWFGWDTKDPRTLWAMTPEKLAEYKKKSREDVLKHWIAENGELVND